MSDKQTVIYTAITGGYDSLPPARFRGEGVRHVCFSDTPVEAEGWEYVPLDREFKDPSRDSRRPKIRPQLFLPDFQISFWLDASFRLNGDLSPLFEEWLRGADIAFLRHPERDCLYDEAVECTKRKLDTASKLESQIKRYEAEGIPRHWGLYSGGFILRRHLKPEVIEFSDLWWEEYMLGSRRDQISLAYTLWKTGIKFNIIPGTPPWELRHEGGPGTIFWELPHLEWLGHGTR